MGLPRRSSGASVAANAQPCATMAAGDGERGLPNCSDGGSGEGTQGDAVEASSGLPHHASGEYVGVNCTGAATIRWGDDRDEDPPPTWALISCAARAAAVTERTVAARASAVTNTSGRSGSAEALVVAVGTGPASSPFDFLAINLSLSTELSCQATSS
mmetsp:Transcript_51424/g.149375  ORF Transcript_51424/g.149375 Transcript_51424/m.149375 type:complete len:158 (+) Transcript_51424:421-894(+)